MNREQIHTILVVDDEADIRRMLEKRLLSWNFQVMTAENGRRAETLIQSNCPDVVITDLFMPGGDGFDLLRHLRKRAPELPVIVISGQGEMGDVIQALRLDAWDYLYKPIENTAFLRLTIDRVLERARLMAENRNYRNNLEKLIAQKSAKLIDQRQALIEKAAGLEQANEALKNLLEHREIEKKAIEQTMAANLKRFVFPYLNDLERQKIGEDAKTYVNIIRANIEQLILPVSKSMSGAYLDLTPMEGKVADLIRQGKSTKSISALLTVSVSTVEKHRNSIRKKLGLVSKSVNLQTYLNSLT